MSTIDAFMLAMPEPQRSTLEEIRERIHALYPDVEEGMHYGVAAFKVQGRWVAGIAARKAGCSYYPMSGRVLDHIDVDALGMSRTSGALQFAADKPLTKKLLKQLITLRLAEQR